MTRHSHKELMAAGATIGLVVGLLVFVVAISAGLIEPNKLSGMLIVVISMLIGGALGAKTTPGSAVAGVFTGIWYLVNSAGTAATAISVFAGVALLLFSCS